ncbi:S41 family peptidase [Dysgonomonas sp.]
MKVKLAFLLLLLSFLNACKDTKDDNDNPNPNPEKSDNKYVNGWIYDELSEYYLWNDKMSSKQSFNLDMDPYDFFDQDGILYKYNAVTKEGDRFSYIEGTHANIPKSATAETNPVTSDIGFEYMYIQYVNQSGNPTGEWAYLVVYVKKDTDAEKQGVKRGHLIKQVNDTKITNDNRFSLLYQNLSSYKLSIDDYELSKTVEKTVNVTYNYTENPIYLDKIFTVNGQKAGYIVYNSFKAGPEATLPYDVELMNILTRFKSEGVENLILDLRYNGGGLVRSAQFLASALVPARNTNNKFEIKTYNPDIQKWLNTLPDNNSTKKSWMYDYFVDNITKDNAVLVSIPKFGDQLKNLYVLCTAHTASASEMTVNTLRPYMKEKGKSVILIGKQTTGKNVGSWPIYEDDKANNTYVMWPIIFKTHNKDMESNYAAGFSPDIELNELSPLLSEGKPLKNLGDENEVLLSAALSAIRGETKSEVKSVASPLFIEQGSSLDRKQGSYKMYESESKSKALKNELKSLKNK